MQLKDGIDLKGHFSIISTKRDGSTVEYRDDNLIMDGARENMAKLIGGVNTLDAGLQINKFVIGVRGHKLDNILDYKKVGSDGFDSTRTMMFSEEFKDEYYTIPFDVRGGLIVDTDDEENGIISDKCFNSKTPNIMETCSVKRTVSGRTCTYEITIGENSGNASASNTSIIAYTEASLYAGDDIFSMKTFPARVKEDSVQFKIIWSIIF